MTQEQRAKTAIDYRIWRLETPASHFPHSISVCPINQRVLQQCLCEVAVRRLSRNPISDAHRRNRRKLTPLSPLHRYIPDARSRWLRA